MLPEPRQSLKKCVTFLRGGMGDRGGGVPEERPYVLNIKKFFKSTEIKDNTCYTMTNAALKMNVQPLKNRQRAHYSLLIPNQSPYLGD